MIELFPLGHASVIIRSRSAVVWCDPVLGDRISGWNRPWPERTVAVDRLPPPDLVVISHHHSDHFSPEDLARVPRLSDVPVLVPRGFRQRHDLQRVGVGAVVELAPFETFTLGDLSITATPSNVDFPEMGLLFATEGARVLHLVDTVFRGLLTDPRGAVVRGCDLALVPFQAGGYMSLLPLRIGGPPQGLVGAIGRWAEESVAELFRELASLAPNRVASFSDGIVYEDDRINAWHFPLSEEAFHEAAGLRAVEIDVGRGYRVQDGGLSTFVHDAVTVVSEAGSRRFEPAVSVGDVPRPGPGRGLWDDRLLARLRPVATANDWALEVLTVDGPSIWLTVDGEPRRHPTRPERSNGLRLWEGDLVDVLEGRLHADVIELGGVFRYWAGEATALEEIRGVVLTPWAMQFQSLAT